MIIIIQSSPRYPLASSPTFHFGKHCMKSLVIKTAWQKDGKPLETPPPPKPLQTKKENHWKLPGFVFLLSRTGIRTLVLH